MTIKLDKEVENIKTEEVQINEAEEYIETSKEMIQYCLDKGALGLAAPQIGINKRFFVFARKPKEYQVIFNPSYFRDGTPTNTVEGCLSYPDKNYFLKKKRYKRIRVVYYTYKDGKLLRIKQSLSGEPSIIFQHETDHLKGITINMIGEEIEQNK